VPLQDARAMCARTYSVRAPAIQAEPPDGQVGFHGVWHHRARVDAAPAGDERSLSSGPRNFRTT